MALMHKSGFQALAEKAGSLVPRALPLKLTADLPVVAQLRFPVSSSPPGRTTAMVPGFKRPMS